MAKGFCTPPNEALEDTGYITLYYNTTEAGYYRRVGKVVQVRAYVSGSIGSAVDVSTLLDAKSRPGKKCQCVAINASGAHGGYGEIYTNGIIRLVPGGGAAQTYLGIDFTFLAS